MKVFLSLLLALFLHFGFSQNFEVYVSDAGNFNNPPWQILKYDSNGQNPSTFISTNLNWPQDILFLEDSNTVLISNLGSNNISRYNAQTGAYINDFATGINGPTRFKIGPDGLLYVLQWNGIGAVKRYNLDGSFVDDFTSTGLWQSIGLDWDRNGNLYVSSYGGKVVQKYDTAGTDMGQFIGSNLSGPTNIWFDDNGDLLVSDYDGNSIKRFDSTGTFVSTFVSGLGNSEGVAFLDNGNFLIGNGATKSVKEYDSAGTYIQDFIASGSGGLLQPNAVVLRPVSSNVSLKEAPISKTFFFPSIGSSFKLDKLLEGQVEQISVLDSSNKVIYQTKEGFWEAGSTPAGVYYARLKFRSGTYYTQKIQVIH